MSGHTPEPWQLDVYRDMGYSNCGFLIRPIPDENADAPIIVQRNPWKNGAADGVRIVQCVNACAGMSDPAAEIAALRRAVEVLAWSVRMDADKGAGQCGEGTSWEECVEDYILNDPIAAKAVREAGE